jgi:hypothetical protein
MQAGTSKLFREGSMNENQRYQKVIHCIHCGKKFLHEGRGPAKLCSDKCRKIRIKEQQEDFRRKYGRKKF